MHRGTGGGARAGRTPRLLPRGLWRTSLQQAGSAQRPSARTDPGPRRGARSERRHSHYPEDRLDQAAVRCGRCSGARKSWQTYRLNTNGSRQTRRPPLASPTTCSVCGEATPAKPIQYNGYNQAAASTGDSRLLRSHSPTVDCWPTRRRRRQMLRRRLPGHDCCNHCTDGHRASNHRYACYGNPGYHLKPDRQPRTTPLLARRVLRDRR